MQDDGMKVGEGQFLAIPSEMRGRFPPKMGTGVAVCWPLLGSDPEHGQMARDDSRLRFAKVGYVRRKRVR